MVHQARADVVGMIEPDARRIGWGFPKPGVPLAGHGTIDDGVIGHMPEGTRQALLVAQDLVHFNTESMLRAGLEGAVNIVVEYGTGNIWVGEESSGSLGDRADPIRWNDVARKRGAHEPTLPIRSGGGWIKNLSRIVREVAAALFHGRQRHQASLGQPAP